jgi:hypothetical protein
MRRIILSVLVLSAALAGGCAGTGEVYYSGGGTLTATTVAPDLVYVSPGVQVIADYDYPVFYADNYYWRFDNGLWYRSSWYTGGWAYATPPRAVLSIDRPYAYRRYRPAGYVSRGAYVRDHRDYGGPVYRDTRPVYRDTRPVYRESAPAAREHTYGGPVYRTQPAPAREAPRAAPATREHRNSDRRQGGVIVR